MNRKTDGRAGAMRIRTKLRKRLPTEAEMRLLQILWDQGEGTVEDIVNAHPPRRKPNYKTTQTLLRIMEQKGYVGHEVNGRVFVFRPLVSRKAIDQRFVQALLAQNFGGSVSGLFLNLLESAPLVDREIDELEEFLDQYRKRAQHGDPDPE